MEMSEENVFFEGSKGIGATAADAAATVQAPAAEESRVLEGESAGRTAAAAAAPAAQPAPPPDAPSKQSSSSSSSSSSRSPLEQKVIDEALKKCFDPEIPVNIWELGLIYSVSVSPEGFAQVSMTLTAPACPVAGSLPGEVEAKVKAVPGVTDAKVELVWDPPWNADMMSRVARVMLGM
jgi:FeS assembly SUF system protein